MRQSNSIRMRRRKKRTRKLKGKKERNKRRWIRRNGR
jgi:hypothetical protein